jgi:hypothetical protein
MDATSAGLPDTDPTIIDPANERLISNPALETRWSVSSMTLWRMKKRDPDLPRELDMAGRSVEERRFLRQLLRQSREALPGIRCDGNHEHRMRSQLRER